MENFALITHHSFLSVPSTKLFVVGAASRGTQTEKKNLIISLSSGECGPTEKKQITFM
jgi:hypothetical protein